MKKYFLIGLGLCFLGIFSGFGQSINVKESPQIEELLELNAKLTKKNLIGQRYKIQVGSYGSIDAAKSVLEDFKASFPGIPADLHYESPNYKVWAGFFTSKLAADRVFYKINGTYKSSFVFMPK